MRGTIMIIISWAAGAVCPCRLCAAPSPGTACAAAKHSFLIVHGSRSPNQRMYSPKYVLGSENVSLVGSGLQGKVSAGLGIDPAAGQSPSHAMLQWLQ